MLISSLIAGGKLTISGGLFPAIIIINYYCIINIIIIPSAIWKSIAYVLQCSEALTVGTLRASISQRVMAKLKMSHFNVYGSPTNNNNNNNNNNYQLLIIVL